MGRPASAVFVALAICVALMASVGDAAQNITTVGPNVTHVPPPKAAKLGVNLGLDGDAQKVGRGGKTFISQKAKNETEGMRLDLNPREMAALLRAFWSGTVSNNTAEATTPDDGYASTMSGAINLNPFLDGTSLSNALALSGKNGSSDSKGMVFGLVGNGRVSSDATALGRTSGSSDVQGLSFNAIGAQSTVSNNLAFTAGAAKTAVKSGAVTVAGPVVTGGLSTAIGIKAASADAKGASITGLGPSSSSGFSNAFTIGTSQSSSGMLATAISGPTLATSGSLATSLDSDAASTSKAKSLSGKGPSASNAGAVSKGRDSSAASSLSNATAIEGGSRSTSASLASGVMASADAGALSAATLGDAKAASAAKALGATSASVATNATARSKMAGYSSSSSSSLRAGTAKKGLFGFWGLPLMPSVPTLWPSLGRAKLRGAVAPKKAPSATVIMGGAAAQGMALKNLLPEVPFITPGFASEVPVEFEAAVAATNETAAPPICNNSTITENCTKPTPLNATEAAKAKTTNETLSALGGLFGGLMDKQKKFMERNTPPAPPRPPAPPPPPRSKKVVIPKRSAPSPLTEMSLHAAALPPLGGAGRPPIPLPVKKPGSAPAPPRPSQAAKPPIPLPVPGPPGATSSGHRRQR